MDASRKMNWGSNWVFAAAVAAALSLVAGDASLAAAGGQSKNEKPKDNKQDNKKDKKGAAAPLLVWPLPPDSPRVKYMTSYHGSIDFKTKKQGRWKTALLGNAPDTGPSDTFVKPYAIAVSPLGRIYVSDTAARRVFAIDRDKNSLTFIGESGSAALTKPVGLAVDGAGVLYVADATLKRILAFSPEGALTKAIGGDGEFDSPAGVAIDRSRNLLYVVDSGRHQIVCYSTTDGAKVRTIGRRGGENGEFNFPTNIFVDHDGRLYVSDTLNFRVQVFEADGTFIRAFGQLGDAPGTFNRPKGIAVDSEGHIYVADSAFNNFQIFDAEGQLLLNVGRGGFDPGQFMLPAGLFIDDRDQIFVADQANGRVQVFQYVRAGAK